MEECSICFELWDFVQHTPLVLRCGHTFCQACISYMMQPEGSAACPNCRLVSDTPVSQLPRNFSLVTEAKMDLDQLLDSADLGAMRTRLLVPGKELQLASNFVLGSGAIGRVCEGQLFGKAVAVQMINLSEIPESKRKALQQEAAVVLLVASECKHSCQYYGCTIKDDNLCIVMKKYCGNFNMALDKAPGGLGLASVLRYSTQILTGLLELQHQGTFMADLKPQNLLWDKVTDELVLAGFGVSRMSRALGLANVSMSAVANYMAPEQFPYEANLSIKLTPAVDIWALGCIMLQMLSGSPPHAGKTAMQIAMQVGLNQRPPAVPDNIPVKLQLLLQMCLAIDPRDRPTARELLKGLQSLQLGANATEQGVMRVLYVKRAESVTTCNMAWQPDQNLGNFKRQLAATLGLEVMKLPLRSTANVETVLGSQHDHMALQQLGWTAECLVLLGDLDAEELQMCAGPNGTTCTNIYYVTLRTDPTCSSPVIRTEPSLKYWAVNGDTFKVELLLAAGAVVNWGDTLDDASCVPTFKSWHLERLTIEVLVLLVRYCGETWTLEQVLDLMAHALCRKGETGLTVTPLLQMLVPLIESKAVPGTKVSCSVSEELLLPCLPLLQRLSATGSIKWCLDPKMLEEGPFKHIHGSYEHDNTTSSDLDLIEAAMQLDPDVATRTTHARPGWQQQEVWSGFSYLHMLCAHGPGSGGPPADMLERLQLVLKYVQPGAINVQHKLIMESSSIYSCRCFKCANTLETPLHMVMMEAGGYKTSYHVKPSGSEDINKPFFRLSDSSKIVDVEGIVQKAERYLPIARVMLEAGADKHLVNNRQQTPVGLLNDIVSAVSKLQCTARGKYRLHAVFRRWQDLFETA